MSEFSSLLSRHIHQKDIKIYPLAQYCGLDRANMYKIINGKRRPSSMEMVTRMCHYMHLLPTEEAELKEAYQIALVGHDNYYRRKSVFRLFPSFHIASPAFPSTDYSVEDFKGTEGMTLLHSGNEVKQALLHIILLENQSDSKYIRMLIQPDCTFLMDLLSAGLCNSKDAIIEHILCFNSSSDISGPGENYNLNCLQQILPLYNNFPFYNCYYYYDNIVSKTGTFDIFPYIIITTQYVCLLSTDMKYGFMTSLPDALDMFGQIFDDYKQRSASLLRQIDNVFYQLKYMQEMFLDNEPGYSFQMTPCMTTFLTSGLLEKYIIPELPERQTFIEMLGNYIRASRKNMAEHPTTFIFSYQGVLSFLETGRIGEYPEDVYTPFERKDRIYLIKQLLQACRTQNYKMLKNRFGSSADELYMFIGKSKGYMMFTSSTDRHFTYLIIEEPGLLTTFGDFFENINENMFYTREETSSLLEELLSSSPRNV